MKYTRKAYEEYLNGLHPNFDSEEWIIGGKERLRLYPRYGTALRRYDPIEFEVGFKEWANNET